MSRADLRVLATRELSFMKAGLDVSAAALGQIERDAHHPALRNALGKGRGALKVWDLRISRAIQQIGSTVQANHSLLRTHYELSRQRRAEATNPAACDLTIVADGQVALSYWIAAFSTMTHYARFLVLESAASEMETSAGEAKNAMERQMLFADELVRRV